MVGIRILNHSFQKLPSTSECLIKHNDVPTLNIKVLSGVTQTALGWLIVRTLMHDSANENERNLSWACGSWRFNSTFLLLS